MKRKVFMLLGLVGLLLVAAAVMLASRGPSQAVSPNRDYNRSAKSTSPSPATPSTPLTVNQAAIAQPVPDPNDKDNDLAATTTSSATPTPAASPSTTSSNSTTASANAAVNSSKPTESKLKSSTQMLLQSLTNLQL